jgi:hypothetical protein
MASSGEGWTADDGRLNWAVWCLGVDVDKRRLRGASLFGDDRAGWVDVDAEKARVARRVRGRAMRVRHCLQAEDVANDMT